MHAALILAAACLVAGCAVDQRANSPSHGRDSDIPGSASSEIAAPSSPPAAGSTAPSAPNAAAPPAPSAGKVAAPPAQPVRMRATKKKVEEGLDRACNWLAAQQGPDGAYGMVIPDVGAVGDVGITAIVVHALAESPRGYREEDGPFVSNAVGYLLANVQPDGGIYNAGQGLENYKTSVSILALTALDDRKEAPRYQAVVEKARAFIGGLQCAEDSEQPYHPAEHKRAYGGIGYGSDLRPDLSNTQFALEALAAAGLSEDSEVFARAITFLSRCQNRRASNDAFDDTKTRSTEDGGFFYEPGESKAERVTNADGTVSYSSYGSMTYAGVKSYIYAGLTKEDPRVKAAWAWIQRNFTVAENPGMATAKNPERGAMGLYYYYVVMARTFDLLGEEKVVTPDGAIHLWANELADQLLSTQSPQGTWSNRVDRWWEGSEQLTTAYSVIALSLAARHLKE